MLGRHQLNRSNFYAGIICTAGLLLSAAACDCEGGPPVIGQLKPEFKSEVTELDFGQVPLGARKDLPVLIQNSGELVLLICASAPTDGMTADVACDQLTQFDPSDAPFGAHYEGVTDIGTWLIDPSQSREMIVSFSPLVEGGVEARLRIHHNGRNAPPVHEIVVRGSGVRPQIDVMPQVLDFGEVTVGQQKQLDIVLTNPTPFVQPTTLGPIVQTSVVFGMINHLSDVIADGQAMQVDVPGNGSITVKASFTPLEEGQATNTLRVSFCPTCSVDIMLLGQGVKPVVEVVPTELNFGIIDEGASEVRSFAIRNVGISAVTVNSVELAAGVTTEYSIDAAVAPSLPRILTSGMEMTVAVTYTGQTPGNDPGQVMVVTNAWDNPATGESEAVRYVNLVAGTRGPDINALPPVINFGTAQIMGAPVAANLLVENTGNSPLTISGMQLNSPTPEITVMLPAFPVQIDPGSSITVPLSYAPQDGGRDEGQLVINSDDRDENPLVVPVIGIGGVPTTCAVGLNPTLVTFGLVERGRRATLPVQVRNTGAQPCNVTNIAISGDPAFGTSSAGMMLTVPPGGSSRIDVDYSPTAYGMHSGQLSFNTDDPVQPNITVPISGTSAPSEIRVIPSELDFSVVPVTCGSPNRPITIYNTGTAPVTVQRVYLDPSTSLEFELCVTGAPTAGRCSMTFSVPATIPAGGSVSFNLRYRPVDIGSDSGVLFIEHSASLVPVAVPLRGDGEVSPTVTDRFTQVPTPQADVLFVVDNSCSMDDEQRNLGSNLNSFLSAAQSQMIDYQIAVVTTDVDNPAQSGRFIGIGGARIITPQTANAATVFQQNTNLGINGSGAERGLEAAYLALTDPLINDPNSNGGFLRLDAALAIIVVSDEEDYSTRTVSFYENFFRNIKGFASGPQFSFNAVVVPSNPPCSGGGASAGTRYVSIAQATGGLVESICTANWGTTLSNIGLNTFGLRRRFNLSAQPVPSTVAVRVDGMPVPRVTPGGATRWVYDQASNAVVFDPSAVPQANTVIEITYTVACLP